MKKSLITLRTFTAIACLFTLSACTQMQLGTMWAMKDVDLSTVDPSVMRIALGLPDGASFSEVSVEMKLSRDEEVLFNEKFDLDIVTTGQEMLQREPRPRVRVR